jgi:hypothetical protein
MWEVFDQARDAIKKNPGCEQFANKTTHVLNIIVKAADGVELSQGPKPFCHAAYCS